MPCPNLSLTWQLSSPLRVTVIASLRSSRCAQSIMAARPFPLPNAASECECGLVWVCVSVCIKLNSKILNKHLFEFSSSYFFLFFFFVCVFFLYFSACGKASQRLLCCCNKNANKLDGLRCRRRVCKVPKASRVSLYAPLAHTHTYTHTCT